MTRWTVQVVRHVSEPETRWFRRVVLRQPIRQRQEVIFTGPAPDGSLLERCLGKPTSFSCDLPIRAFTATL